MVHCVLRDLSSLCQTLTRLASILKGNSLIPLDLSQITQSTTFFCRRSSRNSRKFIPNHLLPYLRNKIHRREQTAFGELVEFIAQPQFHRNLRSTVELDSESIAMVIDIAK